MCSVSPVPERDQEKRSWRVEEREAEEAAADLRRQIDHLKERLRDLWFRRPDERRTDA